jgi:hypothetical protein
MAYGGGSRGAGRFNGIRTVHCSLFVLLAMATGCSKPAGNPSPGADLGRHVIVHKPPWRDRIGADGGFPVRATAA